MQSVVGKREMRLEFAWLQFARQQLLYMQGKGRRQSLGLSHHFSLLVGFCHASSSSLHKDNRALMALKYRGESLNYISLYICMRNINLGLPIFPNVSILIRLLGKFTIADDLLPCTHAAFMYVFL